MPNSQEYLVKVLCLGDVGTGKTAFIHGVVNQTFLEKYTATIGVEYALKTETMQNQDIVRMQLWEVAGQERFSHMTRVYYKETRAVMFFVDAKREKTIEGMWKWYENLLSNSEGILNLNEITVIIVVNKLDLVDAETAKSVKKKVEEYAEKMKFGTTTPEIYFSSNKNNCTYKAEEEFVEDQSVTPADICHVFAEKIHTTESNSSNSALNSVPKEDSSIETLEMTVSRAKKILQGYQSKSIFSFFGSRSAEIDAISRVLQDKKPSDFISKEEIILAVQSVQSFWNTSQKYRVDLIQQGEEAAKQKGYAPDQHGADRVIKEFYDEFNTFQK